MSVARRGAIAVTLAAAFLFAGAQPAFAVFHEIYIREVYPGSAISPDAEYVEVQMYSPGQDQVSGHSITIHDSTGKQVALAKFTSNVASGANQATILAATPAAGSQFGVTADVEITPAGMMSPTGGAVCWDGTPDCVSWGNFSGSLKSPAGSPAAPGGIPDGQALRRTIAPGCASLLERTDDRNNSAVDFEAVFPSPRNNSTPPSEKPCGGGGGGGQGGSGKKGAPQTVFKRKPPKKGHDRTPTFRFDSPNEDRATFQCKVDGKKFKSCRSPFTTKKLSFGSHTFRVRAKDSSGDVDPSPAVYKFKIIG
jgi:hypothetical protein